VDGVVDADPAAVAVCFAEECSPLATLLTR